MYACTMNLLEKDKIMFTSPGLVDVMKRNNR